ncbi:MAG: ComF family protein [Deltaproteobacteria bacterium]|nr:MAG: ComF family protein [Deltaproteobacteria bacterium]
MVHLGSVPDQHRSGVDPDAGRAKGASRLNPLGPLLDLIFPPLCPGCGERLLSAGRLCRDCAGALPEFGGEGCGICGAQGDPLSEGGEVCVRCSTDPPPFRRVYAAVPFAPPVDGWIHRFKYGRERALAAVLAGLVAQRIDPRGEVPPPAFLVPVPLHPTRLRERGFNQALLLARSLGKWWRIPVLPSLIERIRPTPPQARLDHAARRANVAGAFRLRGAVRGERLLLVDDVMTTGATVGACAEILREGGASRIDVVTVARARRRLSHTEGGEGTRKGRPSGSHPT